MTNKLAGKIALVTGGSTGIGLATAKEFVAEGAYVFITGRRQKELTEAVTTIGSNVTGIVADASKLSDLDILFERISKEKGRLDIVFANAGGGSFLPLGSITEEHYVSTFDTNVKGLLFTVQKSLPLLPDGASIILNASTTSVKGLPAFSVYSASKAAVRSFARSWTTDLKHRKIRVNAVSPGSTETPGWMALASDDNQRKAMIAQAAAEIPMNRLAHPREIARVVVFLASDDSSYNHGSGAIRGWRIGPSLSSELSITEVLTLLNIENFLGEQDARQTLGDHDPGRNLYFIGGDFYDICRR